MPRPWIETVQPLPKLDCKRPYRCLVTRIERRRSPVAIIASIRHVEEPNRGQAQRVELPLPIRPGGLTSEFLSACGFDTALNTNVAPKKAEGRQILVRFSNAADSEGNPCAFERPCPEKQSEPASV